MRSALSHQRAGASPLCSESRRAALHCRPFSAAAAPQHAHRGNVAQVKQQPSLRCRVLAAAGASEVTDEDRTQEILAATTRRIKDLGQQGRMKDAIQALAGLAQQGVQPDTLAATTLLRACSKDMALAQNVFDELFGDFLEPDEVTFAVLLRGYGARSPPDWQRIDACLTTMKTKYGIEATAVSYNALLEICVRTNDLDRGQDIIDRMVSDDVEPDEFSLETVAKKRALRSYLRKTFNI